MPPISFLEIIQQLFPYLFGSGGFIFWFLARKERKATIAVTEASANQEMQKAYTQYVLDNNAVIAQLKSDLNEMKVQLKQYIKQCKVCPNNMIDK